MKIRLLFYAVILSVFTSVSAQDTPRALEKVRGTYQIQVIGSRSQPLIPQNLAELIEKNRKQNETVYVSLGTYVRLKVLSLSDISKPEFKALVPVVHITQEESLKELKTRF